MAMTPLGGGDDNGDIVAEINITPLTDIFLVLLIIFMITSSAMIESGGKVNLPKAVATQSESRAARPSPCRRNMKSSSIKKKSAKKAWKKRFKKRSTLTPNKTVILRGDKDVLLGDTVKVMSIIKRAGATEIAIAAEAERKTR